jgi:hypothetical protein
MVGLEIGLPTLIRFKWDYPISDKPISRERETLQASFSEGYHLFSPVIARN